MRLDDYISDKEEGELVERKKSELFTEYTDSDGKLEGLMESVDTDFERFLIIKENFNFGLDSIYKYLKKDYKDKLIVLKNKDSVGVFDLLTEPIATVYSLGRGFLIKYADGKRVEVKDNLSAKVELTKYFREQL